MHAPRLLCLLIAAVLLPGCVVVRDRSELPSRSTFSETRREESVAEINRVLDDWHAAAAEADENRYFAHFAPGAVFLGTDATERWTLEEFRAFARPYFQRGRAWTYVPVRRNVMVSSDGATAWFDEELDNVSFGRCRGTGALVRRPGGWKIAHYNLTVPVPNELLDDVVKMIREREAQRFPGDRAPGG